MHLGQVIPPICLSFSIGKNKVLIVVHNTHNKIMKMFIYLFIYFHFYDMFRHYT